MSVIRGIFGSNGLKLPDQKYKILSISDVYGEIEKLVKEDLEVFEDVTLKHCKILLYHFKWDSEHLLEKYFEAGSFEHFLKKNSIDLDVSLSHEAMVDSYIQTKPLYKWCPNKSNDSCFSIVKLESADVEDITCSCGLFYSNFPLFPSILTEKWKQEVVDPEPVIYDVYIECTRCFRMNDAIKEGDSYSCKYCGHQFPGVLVLSERNELPEYKYYRHLLFKIECLRIMKVDLDANADSYEFLLTANKLARMFLQKLLPLPAFLFFLDREYLSSNPSTSDKLLSLERYKEYIEYSVNRLTLLMDKARYGHTEYDDCKISEDTNKKDSILNALLTVQTDLNILFAFIKDVADEWVFKIPEIRVINNNEISDGMGKLCIEDDSDNELSSDEDDDLFD